MPIAAVPAYMKAVESDFANAAPGHQFNLYLALWNPDFTLDKTGKNEALKPLGKPSHELARESQTVLSALADRQAALASDLPESGFLCLCAKSTSPFVTGLGNEHALENGFSFLNPYGLPYLPGSGVKGVLRRAAESRRDGEFGETEQDGWTTAVIQTLFGTEDEEVRAGSTRRQGALRFWDVIPQLAGNRLQVEVATPHQSDYLQGQESPHDSGSPNPILFLSVPPDSGFRFHVQANSTLLDEDLRKNERWKKMLASAFELAFDWLGFGAKTAVGYGALARDESKEQRQRASAEEARQTRDKAARLDLMSEAEREIEAFIEFARSRLEQLKGGKEPQNRAEQQRAGDLAKKAESQDWSQEEKAKAADAIEEWLPKIVSIDAKDTRKKLKLSQLRGLS